MKTEVKGNTAVKSEKTGNSKNANLSVVKNDVAENANQKTEVQPSFEDMRRKAVLTINLSDKLTEVKEKSSKFQGFKHSSNAYLSLTDDKGVSVTTYNPRVLERVQLIISEEYNIAIEAVEVELKNLAA